MCSVKTEHFRDFGRFTGRVKTVLNAIEADAIQRLLDHHDKVNVLDKLALEQELDVLRHALRAASAHRRAQAKAALARPPETRSGGHGKPPSVALTVSLQGQWDQPVQGARAAHELVVATLEALDVTQQPPSIGTLQVSLSRKGWWEREVATDDGTQMVTVRRDGGVPKRADDLVAITMPKKLGTVRVLRDSPEHKEFKKRTGRDSA